MTCTLVNFIIYKLIVAVIRICRTVEKTWVTSSGFWRRGLPGARKRRLLLHAQERGLSLKLQVPHKPDDFVRVPVAASLSE